MRRKPSASASQKMDNLARHFSTFSSTSIFAQKNTSTAFQGSTVESLSSAATWKNKNCLPVKSVTFFIGPRVFYSAVIKSSVKICGCTDSWPLFAASGVHLANSGLFHFHHVTFFSQLRVKVGNTLTKDVVLCVNLNLDGVSITSRTHTHPSHSQTSRLLHKLVFSIALPLLIYNKQLLIHDWFVYKLSGLLRSVGQRVKIHIHKITPV